VSESERVGIVWHGVHLVARRRVALGFACGIAVLWLAAPTRATILAGLPIALVGELVRVWAAGHLNKSREVTNSGPYRFVAHPLYLGSSFIGAGLAVGSGSLAVIIIIAVYLLVTLSAAIKSEEAFLRGKFGDEYDQFRDRGSVDRTRRFTWAQAMANHEYRAVVGVALALLVLVLKATYNRMF